MDHGMTLHFGFTPQHHHHPENLLSVVGVSQYWRPSWKFLGEGGLRRLSESALLKKALHCDSPSLSHNTDHTVLLPHFTWPFSSQWKIREGKKKNAGTSLASTDGRVGLSCSPGSRAEHAQRRAPLIRHEGDSHRAFNCTADSAQSVYSCAPLVKVTVF